MSTQTYALVRLTLFKHSAGPFLAALDEAQIPHAPIHMFSTNPQGSGFVEAITALSDAMPWNAIAKVAVAWIEARKSREIIIHTETGDSIHAKGYSASEVQKLLQKSTNVIVIDTKPVDEP
ncbi:hypothetical protein SAMN03159414_1959 [Pseudomonas sp. NFACC41-3]|uniref:hypothetical protein n=1 Tax=unclassified Pseudomonas TaxID=196821 RepID=UPI0008CDA5F8|nr:MULTISPECIES: hypothetical protein [unclassified Pseudomonas]SEL19798.1 hypothetical protein SAMN03159414_1959 [Pseudomonas sp. NFACC41-3]